MIGDDQLVAWRCTGKRIATSSNAAHLSTLSSRACDKYLAATGTEAPIDAEVDAELIAHGFGPSALADLPVERHRAIVALHRWRAIGPLLAEVAPVAFLHLLRVAQDACGILDEYPVVGVIAAATERLATAEQRGGVKRRGRKRKASNLDDDSPIVWQTRIEALTAAASLGEARGSREVVAWGHLYVVTA